MHSDRMALARSVWADLDALVLEEVNALNATPAAPETPAFSSEEDFVVQAKAYLRQRDDPLRVIEDLTRELGLGMSENLEMADLPLEEDETTAAAAPEAPAAAEVPPEPGPGS
jgi:hypothetical protein